MPSLPRGHRVVSHGRGCLPCLSRRHLLPDDGEDWCVNSAVRCSVRDSLHTLCRTLTTRAPPPVCMIRSECADCPAGRYTSASRATNCTSCPDGTFADGVRRTSCSTCPPGFVSVPLHTTCIPCKAGQYRYNTTTCAPCPMGHVSEEAGVACRPCPSGTFADVHQCSKCPPDTYSINGGSCLKCPSCTGPRCTALGTTCSNGILELEGYYWTQPLAEVVGSGISATGNSQHVYRCLLDPACGGLNGSTLLPKCAAGYAGALCNMCDAGYTKQLDGSCGSCDRESLVWSTITIVATVVVGLLALVLIVRYKHVLPTATFKVLIAWAQILATGEALFATQWPHPYSTVVQTLRVRACWLASRRRSVGWHDAPHHACVRCVWTVAPAGGCWAVQDQLFLAHQFLHHSDLEIVGVRGWILPHCAACAGSKNATSRSSGGAIDVRRVARPTLDGRPAQRLRVPALLLQRRVAHLVPGPGVRKHRR